ncbi:hypothetical protein VTJ04DRAFT_3709 [Mycothermus thermophilus]|uniref:uncharacterized protein n=1 Tax=Humicola insolens TaxID=85995 RepID=UPI0037434E0E
MVAFPYHLLKVCGGIVFAAQGSNIHSFNSAFEHISTWKYPMQHGANESANPVEEAQDSPAPEGPPAKRRRVEGDDKDAAENGNAKQQPSNGQSKAGKKGAQYDNPSNERPFLQGLYATSDGRHLIAITGCDKTIWVFEHDGAGHLKQLSQRAMPKRPCALALTRDNKTILSADKFGDVYALPLIPDPNFNPDATTTTTTRVSTPSSAAPTPTIPLSRSETPVILRPEANEFTVHTKRNLRALENQKISLERKAQREAEQQEQLNRPKFEHTLLLGHVSMLTSICVGLAPSSSPLSSSTGDERRKMKEYILTSDRDEHIRVSRGIPQSHVIETFCLGHEDFVSRLCIPPGGREDLLISAGGDDDLLVWDWLRGKLLTRASVLEQVKALPGLGEANKVAVTRVVATNNWWGQRKKDDGGTRTAVVVLAEKVPAVFVYELEASSSSPEAVVTLTHRATVPLPGNPLDVEVLADRRLVVALDPSLKGSEPVVSEGEGQTTTTATTLVVVDNTEGEGEGGEVEWQLSPVGNLPNDGGKEVGEAELSKLLYTTEGLRKLTDFE